MSLSSIDTDTGAEAAAAPGGSNSRPLLIRVAVGAMALLGLSGIGAVSMLAGLDGAHASPPAASSVWVAPSVSSAGPSPAVASATREPEVTPIATGIAPSEAPPCPTKTEDGRIILNLAKLDDLRKIPGVGPKRAEAILALRAKLKRFKRPAELLRIRGIGPKSLARMQSHFVLDAPVGGQCDVSPTSAK